MRRSVLPVLAAAAVAVACSAPVEAATPPVTAQAQAADAAFLAYAPPPAGGAGALCLVDTGVDVNPDTQQALVSASAVDSGSGNDVDPGEHGTTMAMIAAGAGQGIIGAWPAIKIVSVRAATAPTPGRQPTFEFDDYVYGMNECSTLQRTYRIDAIDLALSSTIPPSPDQAQAFANAVAVAHGQNVAVLAAAGNQPGPTGQPAAQPGVFAVGASTAQADTLSSTAIGTPCNFSATQGLTLFAPGCGLDEADPLSDQPTCCGNGTSQASAFTAAVVVALRSYDPTLSFTAAEQLLISTATNGNLDVAAAFQAAGLSAIIAQGNANIPIPIPKPGTSSRASTPAGPVVVRVASWRGGRLRLTVSGLTKASLSIELEYRHAPPRRIQTRQRTITIRTPRPRLVLLRVMDGHKQLGKPITVHPA